MNKESYDLWRGQVAPGESITEQMFNAWAIIQRAGMTGPRPIQYTNIVSPIEFQRMVKWLEESGRFK